MKNILVVNRKSFIEYIEVPEITGDEEQTTNTTE